MGVENTRTLKSIFSIFLIKTILGLVLSVLIPVLLFWISERVGIVHYADSGEIEAMSVASTLKNSDDPAAILNKLSNRIEYLYVNHLYEVQMTSMDNDEQDSAMTFLKEGNADLRTSLRYLTVEKSGEIILLQYRVGTYFANAKWDKVLPSPEIILIMLIVICGFVSAVFQVKFLERKIQRELKPIFDATHEFAMQNLDYQIKHSKIREFEEVMSAFDDMSHELRISLRKQWEIEKQQKEQIAALAHDFKTPMTVTLGNLDLLEETELDKEQSELLSSAIEGLNRMSGYLQLMMEMTMLSVKYQYRFNMFNLSEFLYEIEKQGTILCRQSQIHFKLEVGEVVESCYGSIEMLERAVMNVIQNAVEYTPPGGNVCMTASMEGDFWRLQIEDNGNGFSPKMLKQGTKLFAMDDISRTKGSHYGMGLYFAYSVAKKHGGKMLLENSEITGGAKIIFLLKLRKI